MSILQGGGTLPRRGGRKVQLVFDGSRHFLRDEASGEPLDLALEEVNIEMKTSVEPVTSFGSFGRMGQNALTMKREQEGTFRCRLREVDLVFEQSEKRERGSGNDEKSKVVRADMLNQKRSWVPTAFEIQMQPATVETISKHLKKEGDKVIRGVSLDAIWLDEAALLSTPSLGPTRPVEDIEVETPGYLSSPSPSPFPFFGARKREEESGFHF